MNKKTDKPWGYEDLVELNDIYAVKFLFMKKGQQCSLQHHEKKKETIIILEGELDILFKDEWKTYNKHDVLTIPPKQIHRMKASRTDCLYMECSTPELEDVVRHEDDYKRS